LTPPITPLAAAIAARDTAIAEIAAIEAKIKKLEAHAQSSSPATIELAQLRDDNTKAFAAWSETSDGPPPKVDAKRQAKLEDEIAAHNLSVQSANSAISSLVAQRTAAFKTRDGAGRYATIAAVERLVETESVALFREINAAGQAYIDL
jgi:hypothetical protein